MGIVGKTEKQPAETDVYGINLADDLSPGDAPDAAHAFVMVHRQAGAVVAVGADATVTTPRLRYLLSGGAALTLAGMAAGDRVYVSNKDPIAAASLASADLIDGAATVALIALHGLALVKTAAGRATDAAVRVVVDVADKRVRNWISGGTDGTTYKIETTTTTAEGRVLQDEIIMKVKET